MDSKRLKRLRDSVGQLDEALAAHKKEERKGLFFLAVIKAFEVVVEYAWREMKSRVEEEGLEAPSPKEAIRQAARIHIIDNPQDWLAYLSARNDSVHNYFGIGPDTLLEKATSLARDSRLLLKKFE